MPARHPSIPHLLIQSLAVGAALGALGPCLAFARGGQLVLSVVDYESQKPLTCRMHLKTAAGKPRLVRSQPAWHDHFVVDGQIKLELPVGQYQFEIERGPEYVNAFGHFEIEDGADDQKTVELKRGVDMSKAGWWSGEFDARRPVKDLELLMMAEDLHVLPTVALADKRDPRSAEAAYTKATTQFDGNRFYDLGGRRDDRDGGPLLYFGLTRPLDLKQPRYDATNGLEQLLGPADNSDVWIDVPLPAAWDLPLWLAAGVVDSIELTNSQSHRVGAAADPPSARRRDPERFRGDRGVGLWSQFLYYQVLNAGFRIPPSAGSGSGVAPNPLGYNRMYVYAGEELTYDGWWEGLRAGKVIVTNGPLIQPIVAGKRPGHVFRAPAGETIGLDINLHLTTRDPISYLEIVKDGEVERAVRLDEWASHGGQLPALKFRSSGWFVIRAVTDVDKTYRFASSGPYYVEIGDEPRRISRAAAQYFLDWTIERIAMLEASKKKGPKTDLEPYQQAMEFWKRRVAKANAD